MSKAKTLPYHHPHLKEKLIKKALEIIRQQGAQRLTMRQLSKELHVSHTAVYRHFKSKNELMCIIKEKGFRQLKGEFRKVNQLNIDPLIKMEKIALIYIAFALKNPCWYRLMFRPAGTKDERTPSLEETIISTLQELLAAIIEGQKRKKVKHIHPLIIANTCWSLAHGLSDLLINEQVQSGNVHKMSPFEFAHLAVKLVIEGLKK